MDRISYNFAELESAVSGVKNDQSAYKLNELKRQLNKFFKGSECKDVIYTQNTDKFFFGMCVMPVIKPNDAVAILGDPDERNKYIIEKYYVEIDSKLLELGMSTKELTAILLHEVGHLVNDSIPAVTVRNIVDNFLANTDGSFIVQKIDAANALLAFGIKDAMRKLTSIFYVGKDEIIADEFTVACGYGRYLESAFDKIIRKSGKINKDTTNKLVLLQWTLRIYSSLKTRRIALLHALKRGKLGTGSSLEKREMENMIRYINTINPADLISESAIGKLLSNKYKDFKFKGIRALEDDLYEYSLRCKNVNDEEEAIAIIRQMNSRIGMIDDYLMTEKISDAESKRWHELSSKYRMLREELAKKTTYSEKFYGLFVQTPVIKSRYEM